MTSPRSAAPRSAAAVRRAVPAREYRLPCGIHRAFTRADEAWRSELAATTIASLVVGVLEEAPPAAIEKAARWLGEAVR